jgi:hypothetical protein
MYKNKNEMTMNAKRFVTYVFLGNLGFSPRKINCSVGEVSFSSGELGFFPKENSLLPPNESCVFH